MNTLFEKTLRFFLLAEVELSFLRRRRLLFSNGTSSIYLFKLKLTIFRLSCKNVDRRPQPHLPYLFPIFLLIYLIFH